MSRSGRIPINIPENTEIKLDNGVITAKGKLGELSFNFGKDAKVDIDNKSVIVAKAGNNKYFEKMLDIKDMLDQNLKLSMGMSGDYLMALKYNSNLIRVGSLIFEWE